MVSRSGSSSKGNACPIEYLTSIFSSSAGMSDGTGVDWARLLALADRDGETFGRGLGRRRGTALLRRHGAA